MYLAREKASGVVVALKVIFKKHIDRWKLVSQLQEEVEIQTRLRHPGVLRGQIPTAAFCCRGISGGVAWASLR